MRLTAILLLVAFLHVSGKTAGQTVTLSLKNAPIQKVFREIIRQTHVSILYDEKLFAGASPVTIDVHNATVNDVLKQCLQNQPVQFRIEQNTIRIEKESVEPVAQTSIPPPIDIHGRITDSLNNPLAGASIFVKGTKRGTISDANGNFTLKGVNENQTLIISFTGYIKKEFKVNGTEALNVSLSKSNNSLDAVVVIPYGTTTERLNTGDISTVTAKTIEEQPVSNPLSALEGRVAGLVITQTTGLPGGAFKVQIRGQNSLYNGNDPFYVIDGVPYDSQLPTATGNGLLNGTLNGGSPLSYINPNDIESIEVLKDADATAIYGSRAANGAILITTKKGKAGPMKIDVSLKAGQSTPARSLKLMNTQQYLAMRNEAFQNDGKTPQSYDYDVNGIWDTTRYTDWTKTLVTSKTAHYDDAELSLSGGNANTQWLVGGGYIHQATGFQTLIPSDGADQIVSVHLNLNTVSTDKKFTMNTTATYLSDKNTVQSTDFSRYPFQLAPDAPPLYNPDGSLNWAPVVPGQGGTWGNPLAQLNMKYEGLTSNLIANTILSYTLFTGLELRASLGYTNTQANEVLTNPSTETDPAYRPPAGYSSFNSTNSNSWIIEPTVNYKLNLGKGVFTALVGTTFQEHNSKAQNIQAYGFISDALLEDVQAASSSILLSNSNQYKYEAIYTRIGYNWQDKYLINLSGRRDGSSRFGPDKQFGNFGAVGAAWIFTQEKFIQQGLPFLSFGKIRGSYGVTGNDQIPDYQFLDLYTITQYPYLSSQGLYPQNLFNPALAWERNTKLEGAIELGFLKDRISIGVSFYQNKSGNQLLSSVTSLVTGYGGIEENFPAVVQNAGTEFTFHSLNIKTRDFNWSSSINLSIQKNKLLSFQNLAASPYYSQLLTIGQPVNNIKVFHMIGVNDTSGVYQFSNSKGDPTYKPNISTDLTTTENLSPEYYGGFLNNFNYKGLSLDIFFQFVKQKGRNIFGANPAMAGTMSNNQPLIFENRWQKPGDKTNIQKFSEDYDGPAQKSLNYAQESDFIYSDASYIRLKNIACSWQFPQAWKQKIHAGDARVYIQAQNLLTITHYNGLDPETQNITSPPMKTWVVGFKFVF